MKAEDEHGGDCKEWCEPCDRSFHDNGSLTAHLAEHEVCGRDGCKYEAHPRLIQLHVRLQHSTGLYRRIHSGQQSLEQWIEERKKNFPTKENMEKKKAQQKEMEERGERLQNDDNKIPRKNIGNKRRRQNEHLPNKRMKMDKPQRQRRRRRPSPARTSLIAGLPAECFEDEPAAGKGQGVVNSEEGFSDGEWCEGSTPEAPRVSLTNSSLLSLMSNYDSDAEDDGTNNAPDSSVEMKANTGINTQCKEDSDGSGPEETPIEKREGESGGDVGLSVSCGRPNAGSRIISRAGEVVKSELTNPRHNNRCNQSAGDWKHRTNLKQQPAHLRVPTRQLTLLEKLLKDDILKERNQLLQCVRYVVENNFFDTPPQQPSNTPDDDSTSLDPLIYVKDKTEGHILDVSPNPSVPIELQNKSDNNSIQT